MVMIHSFFSAKNPSGNSHSQFKFKFNLLLLSLTVFLLSISLISAAQINFTKDSNSFDKGETLIAKVSANFLEQPTRSNVFFYRNGNPSNIPFVYEIANINDDFYLYALIADKQAGNYSLVLEKIKYMKGALESEENLVKNFIITENLSDFSVTPGFIKTSQDFSLEVQNLQENQITISISTPKNLSAQKSITVKSGEIKEIPFVSSGQSSEVENIKLSSTNTKYLIPSFVNSNVLPSSASDITSSNGEESFRLEPNQMSVSMATNSTAKRIVYVLNTGDLDLENLTFSIPTSLVNYVTISSPSTVGKNSSEQVEITINSGSIEKSVSDEVTVRTENTTSSFEISLDFISDYIAPVGEETSSEPVILTTCTQLKGKVCTSNETCSGETAKVSEGVCCVAPAQCEVIKKSSTGKIIGWSMVALVILFLLWFFKRYKRVRPQIDLLKIGARK
ncbi:MAG: hypothetical protein AABX91_03115 [Nanoarchaeota archaeon]